MDEHPILNIISPHDGDKLNSGNIDVIVSFGEHLEWHEKRRKIKQLILIINEKK